MLVKRTRSNQITIPKKIMQNFETAGYFDVIEKKGMIILKPVDIKAKESILPQVREKMKKLKITQYDINEAVSMVRDKCD